MATRPAVAVDVADTARPERVNVTGDDALGTSDVVDLLNRLARREVSPAELRVAALARAERANITLNALTTWFDDPLPAVQRRSAEGTGGPLAGIPTAVKDNETIAGVITTHCSWAVPDRPARITSPIVTDLLNLGMDPIGKTTLPEFGLTATTESSRFGATRNPWRTDRSTGGSSGGSAALVASGVIPIAHANDGGGSTRIPAAACGLVGLKPTRGRLLDPPELARLPIAMVTQGVLTRSVRDTALLYAQVERLRPVAGLPPIGHVISPGARRLRIGMVLTPSEALPQGVATLRAVRDAGLLCERLGHHVEETGPPVAETFGPDFLRYWALLAFLLVRGGRGIFGPGFDPDRLEGFSRGLAGMLASNAERVPGSIRRLRQVARRQEDAFDQFDVLLTPVIGHPAPPIGYLGPDVDFRTHLIRLLRFASVTALQNVSGSPAISLPLGLTDQGLPIGVQFGAPFGQERLLLELALELEQAAPWPSGPPLS